MRAVLRADATRWPSGSLLALLSWVFGSDFAECFALYVINLVDSGGFCYTE